MSRFYGCFALAFFLAPAAESAAKAAPEGGESRIEVVELAPLSEAQMAKVVPDFNIVTTPLPARFYINSSNLTFPCRQFPADKELELKVKGRGELPVLFFPTYKSGQPVPTDTRLIVSVDGAGKAFPVEVRPQPELAFNRLAPRKVEIPAGEIIGKPVLINLTLDSGSHQVVLRLSADSIIGGLVHFPTWQAIDAIACGLRPQSDQKKASPAAPTGSPRPRQDEYGLVLDLELPALEPSAPKKPEAAKQRREDLDAPVVTHQDPGRVLFGRVKIKLRVDDISAIWGVVFHWRYVGETHYRQIELASPDQSYVADLDVTGPFEFWAEAFDEMGNGPGLDGTPEKPIQVKVASPPKSDDTAPPLIGCIPPEKKATMLAGGACLRPPCAEFLIRIKDTSTVFGATLHWRHVGSSDWRQANLTGADQLGYYRQKVGPVLRDVEYWIEAYDEHGNGPATLGTQDAPRLAKIGDSIAALYGFDQEAEPEMPPKRPEQPSLFCRLLAFLPCCP